MRRLPALATSLIAAATAALTAMPAAATHPPTDRTTTGTAGTVSAIDARDPDLALPTGTTLAEPKILDLTAPQLDIHQRIDNTPPGASRQPGTADTTPPPAHPTGSTSETKPPPATPDGTRAPEQTGTPSAARPLPTLPLARAPGHCSPPPSPASSPGGACGNATAPPHRTPNAHRHRCLAALTRSTKRPARSPI
ncbi:hypothetical protein EJ357_46640 [Streptomyces cyaneochromogenes]|uniref:Secreted protein n=1 Tax=Streptomyces cyaneochromogenes TaxID=2496836 RepID=A0A3S9ML99_9ACTN|nr:hypothetical protein [Streptomyces cyaneochromogenes]AZQ39969.1 hypothetical protein EJ357_46640 [Streptomyces cyaneochromogenes]